jgi:hypothetical protein
MLGSGKARKQAGKPGGQKKKMLGRKEAKKPESLEDSNNHLLISQPFILGAIKLFNLHAFKLFCFPASKPSSLWHPERINPCIISLF